MATTSLWHIKGRLKDLINYVENPEKTASKMPELQDLYNVFSYSTSGTPKTPVKRYAMYSKARECPAHR